MSSNFLISQSFDRIKAEVSIKTRSADGVQLLTIGQVYYNRINKQTIYYVSFPEKEVWINEDTIIYRVQGGELKAKSSTFAMSEFSIFHMALSCKLQDFGLKDSPYAIKEVIYDQNMVITTWSPPAKYSKNLGNILVSTKNKILFGVLFQDPQGIILQKQFFEDYHVSNGLAFPGKVIQINVLSGKESYQLTTYKNIKVNEMGNDSKYFYPVGSLH